MSTLAGINAQIDALQGRRRAFLQSARNLEREIDNLVLERQRLKFGGLTQNEFMTRKLTDTVEVDGIKIRLDCYQAWFELTTDEDVQIKGNASLYADRHGRIENITVYGKNNRTYWHSFPAKYQGCINRATEALKPYQVLEKTNEY